MPTTSDTDKEPTHPHLPADTRSEQPPDPGGQVIVMEQAHLHASRECLRRMRENVLSLKALGGDRGRGPSTGRAPPRRWACHAAAGLAFLAANSPPTKTRTLPAGQPSARPTPPAAS